MSSNQISAISVLQIIFGFTILVMVLSFMAYGIEFNSKKMSEHIDNLVNQNVVGIEPTTYQSGLYHAVTNKGWLVTFSGGEKWVIRKELGEKVQVGGHIEPTWIIEQRK